jgi:hypothetical protein
MRGKRIFFFSSHSYALLPYFTSFGLKRSSLLASSLPLATGTEYWVYLWQGLKIRLDTDLFSGSLNLPTGPDPITHDKLFLNIFVLTVFYQ